MPEDKREAILARLVDIAKTIVDPNHVFRNKLEIAEDFRPAIIILDQDEVKDETKDPTGRGRPPEGPFYMLMSPEVFILERGTPEEIGSKLNAIRVKVIKEILKDAPLRALCSEPRYEGFSTALASGRSMEGQARVHFTLPYVLRTNLL